MGLPDHDGSQLSNRVTYPDKYAAPGWYPLLIDVHGSGLYEADGGARAWSDKEHPEDRWIRDMTEPAAPEPDFEAMERERDLDLARTAERERWAEEDDDWPWRKRERPAGLMYGLEDRRG